MRIYLIGYMYSGKTTIGHKLAQRLGYRWADLDQVLETTFHTTIPIFFKRYGEEAFPSKTTLSSPQGAAHLATSTTCNG